MPLGPSRIHLPGAVVPGALVPGAWGIGAWGLGIGGAGEARPCIFFAWHLPLPLHLHLHLHAAFVLAFSILFRIVIALPASAGIFF